MNCTVDERSGSRVAVLSGDGILIGDVNDALDLMANVRYNGCDKMVIRKENITEEFFDLKTRLAGEIAQKYVNYGMRIAIVGDFSGYTSKSLNDWIYECNQGDRLLFKKTEAEALDALHAIASS